MRVLGWTPTAADRDGLPRGPSHRLCPPAWCIYYPSGASFRYPQNQKILEPPSLGQTRGL